MKRAPKSCWVNVKSGTKWPEVRHVRHARKKLGISNKWVCEDYYQPSAPYELEPSGYYPCFQLIFYYRG